MKKTEILYSMILLIVIICAGCQKQEKSLTICVDSYFVGQVKDLIDAWQQFNKDINVDLVVIPKKVDEAEIKITEIRTAIMSGDGPDIFIMNTDVKNLMDGPIPLFENVEKTMQSEVFLPLDDYMAQAEYMHVDAFNPLIFDSGKTDEGQLVLPIYYGYTVGAYLEKDDTFLSELPYTWDDLVNYKGYDLEKNCIPSFSGCFYDVFGKYADYKSRELLFTETEMLTRVQEAISLGTQNYLWEDYGSERFIQPIGMIFPIQDINEKYIFNAIPSVEGGITANVIMYAAINRNTRWPDEAFSILDMLFSDEIMTGRGFEVEEKYYGQSAATFSPCYGVLTHEEGRCSSLKLSDENLQAFNDLNSRITSVRYYSNLDDDLQEMYNKCLEARDEEEQKKIVNQIYKRMQMKLSE